MSRLPGILRNVVGMWLLTLVAFVQAAPATDPISDAVGATQGMFRVDESGSGTYAIPIYTPPGTAGVVPKLALTYSSQGGVGPLGKGWSIGGTSTISRCRATREAGDFIVGGVPQDGDPPPVNLTSSDKFCLDGVRLVPAPVGSPACKTLSGTTATPFRTETETFQRICAYTFDSNLGPRFFTVERKDGSTSWYGDRATTSGGAAGPRTDGTLDANGTGQTGKVIAWAQTRFQDSTGNYIDYLYLKNPGGASYPGEQPLSEVQYTGKVVLSGQSGTAKTPYAKVTFNYTTLATTDFVKAYVAGSTLSQTQRLQSITVRDGTTVLRHYPLTYVTSVSGSGAATLTQLKECSDVAATLCLPPTVFDWSVAHNAFETYDQLPSGNFGDFDNFEGYKLADVDGDGLLDLVRLKDGSAGDPCSTESIMVSFGELDATGTPVFTKPTQASTCSPTELMPGLGDDSWDLIDYNGDGRADLYMTGPTGGIAVVYASLGRPASGGAVFNSTTNLIANLPGGGIPGTNSPLNTPRFADLNGDGLVDIIYAGNFSMAARLMERGVNGFGWGAERTVAVGLGSLQSDCDSANYCIITEGPFSGGHAHFPMLDINGDARSDMTLQLKMEFQSQQPGCQPQLPSGGTDGTATDGTSSAQTQCFNPKVEYFLTATVTSITATTVNVGMYSAWQTLDNPSGIPSTLQADQQFGDFNGDGLMDMVASDGGNNWTTYLNNGLGYLAGVSIGNLNNKAYMQVVDVNGDGRSDIVFPGTDYNVFQVRYGSGSGTIGTAVPAPGGYAWANCSDNACLGRHSFIFADIDGDGATDFLNIKWVTSGGEGAYRFHLARPGVPSRYQPRDTVIRITNGYGALTQLVYLPMTNGAIYRRDYLSRDQLNYGRGSAVQDFQAATYVVAMVRASAPTAADPLAQSALYYRYAGARLQGGGRGFLGFREITAFDNNFAGKTVATTTTYQQSFPFVGTPVQTVRVVANSNYTPDPCFTTVTDACFLDPGVFFTAPQGMQISESTQSWETQDGASADLTTQKAQEVRVAGTYEEVFDLDTGVRTTLVITAFDYDAWGNATLTQVDTYTGTSNTNPVTLATSNTYTNDGTNWRLGRLTASSVTHTRDGVSITRHTGFDYSMTGPVTGLLTAERTEPGGATNLELKKFYTLDVYGNRTATYTCSNSTTDSTCQGVTGFSFQPANDLDVRRYAKQTFDTIGRYALTTAERFRTAAGSSEVTSATVVNRDIFGEPTDVQDVNSVHVASSRGALGRPYWSWAQTVAGATLGDATKGIDSTVTYRWCGTGTNQVPCPTGAVFRQKTVTDGSPTQWVYYDVLGRTLMKAAETFNAGRLGWDFAASCTLYDSTGRPSQVTDPYFLSEAAVNGEPTFTAFPGTCTSPSRNTTYTWYDVLGRPTTIMLPDGSATQMAYTGLVTTTTNGLGQTKVETKNASGELVSVTDNGLVNGPDNGELTTTYAYDAAGNLASVSRDVGRGTIVSSMTYDVLGRKLTQSDPDAGSWTYTYDALGEQITQQDGGTKIIRTHYDARGRVYSQTTESAAVVETTTSKVYDTATNGKGQLASESITGTYAGWVGQSGTGLGFSRSATYDTLGRQITTSTVIDGLTYPGSTTYDTLGRPWKVQDQAGYWLKTEFTARGFAVRMCDSTSADSVPTCTSGSPTTWNETQEIDAYGHVTQEMRGGSNAMIVHRTYDPFSARLTQICAGGALGGCEIANLQYGWDVVGNLQFRDMGNYREEFTYDGNNRLAEGRYGRVGGIVYTGNNRPISTALTYDPLGNICSKTINGAAQAYTYAGRAGCGLNGLPGTGGTGTASPHAVSAVAGLGTTYSYDGHGNQTLSDSTVSGADRFIQYTAADQAYEIARGSIAAPTQRTRFWYGSDGARYKREDIGGGLSGTQRTLYVGNLEIVSLAGVTTTKRYIAGVAMIETVGSTVTPKFLFSDNLGSIARVTNASGAVLEGMDYAAFGERRVYTDPRNYGFVPVSTKRGFTGHEHVDGFDVIHMNGRIYDCALGRFLQADPVIQDPSNPQNFNRYTYVWNNPLAYTDPSGFSTASTLQTLGAIFEFLGYIFDNPYLTAIGEVLSYAGEALSVIQAFENGGAKAGLLTAFSYTRWGSDIIVSGLISTALGGSFKEGVLGALKSKAIGFVMFAMGGSTGGDLSSDGYENGAMTDTETDVVGSEVASVDTTTPEFQKIIATNTVRVETIFSQKGDTFADFSEQVGESLFIRRNETGLEYNAAYSSRTITDGNGTWTQYGAVVQTQNSHVFSAPYLKLTKDGWSPMKNELGKILSMHIHGKDGGHATETDLAYMPNLVSSTTKIAPRIPVADTEMFSTQDSSSPGMLMTLRHGILTLRKDGTVLNGPNP